MNEPKTSYSERARHLAHKLKALLTAEEFGWLSALLSGDDLDLLLCREVWALECDERA